MIPGKILEAINPYSLYIKLGFGIVLLLTVLGFLWSWHDRGRRIEALESWQTIVINKISDATVPDKKRLNPAGTITGIDVLVQNLADTNRQLDEIDKQAQAAKARADEADKRLGLTIAEYDRRAAAASKRIADLNSRIAAKTPAEANAAIAADSKAAWEGWR